MLESIHNKLEWELIMIHVQYIILITLFSIIE